MSDTAAEIMQTMSPAPKILLATFSSELIDVKSAFISAKVKELHTGFRRMLKRKVLRSVVVGSVRITEIALDTTWLKARVHLHCCLAVKPCYYKPPHYLDKGAWQELWASVGIKGGSVKVKGLGRNAESVGGVIESVRRWVGYGLKGSWLSAAAKLSTVNQPQSVALIKEIIDGLKGRRLVATAGAFRSGGE